MVCDGIHVSTLESLRHFGPWTFHHVYPRLPPAWFGFLIRRVTAASFSLHFAKRGPAADNQPMGDREDALQEGAPDWLAGLNALTEKLEAELRGADLWAVQSPTDVALRSVQPFGCDMLRCEQWLQWIFLPRMRSLLRAGAAPPGSSSISNYAEESLPVAEPGKTRVLEILREIDRQICLAARAHGTGRAN